MTRYRRVDAFIRIACLVCLAALLGVIAVSSLLPYGALRDRLVQSYGEDRTARYLSPARFASVMFRLRLIAGLLSILPIVALKFRRTLAEWLHPFFSALSRSFSHLRRHGWRVNPWVALALSAMTLIGLMVRLQFIDQPMRDDESTTTMLYALKPFYIGVSIYVKPNNHLFHTLLVHLFTQIAGSAEWALRTPALAAGLLLIPLTYELVRRFTSVTAALWAAALVSSSSVMVEYSTNARGYTILCCAAAAIVIAGWEMLRNASPVWFAAFGIGAFLGCWTIPVFLIPLGGTVVWVGWKSLQRGARFRRIFWIRLAITGAIAGLAVTAVYVPPMTVSGLNGLLHDEYITPHSFQSFLDYNKIGFERTWALFTRDLPNWCVWLMPVGFLVSLVLLPQLRVLVISLVGWTLLLFIARRYVTLERTWLVFLPLFFGGAAFAPAYLFDRWIPKKNRLAWGALSAVILAGCFSIPVVRNRSILASKQTGVLKSASQIVQYLIDQGISPNLVLRDPDYDFPLQYYYWRRNGVNAPQADPNSLNESHVTQGWLLVNADIGESFSANVEKFGIQDVQVLDEHPFDGSRLYRIKWTAIRARNPAYNKKSDAAIQNSSHEGPTSRELSACASSAGAGERQAEGL